MSDDKEQNNGKLKLAGLVLAVSSLLATSATGIYGILEKIDRNTIEIQHNREIHDRDIQYLKNYNSIKEEMYKDQRKEVKERLRRFEENCDKVRRRLDDKK